MKLKTKQEILDIFHKSWKQDLGGHLLKQEDYLGDEDKQHPFFDYESPDDFLTYELLKTNIQQVYRRNNGDGRLYELVLNIVPYDILICIHGIYSSYGPVEVETCFLAEPYTFSETRYRKKKEQ